MTKQRTRVTVILTAAALAVVVAGAAILAETGGTETTDTPWAFPEDPLDRRHPQGVQGGEPFDGVRMQTIRSILNAYQTPYYLENPYESYRPEPGAFVEFEGTLRIRRNQRLEETLEQVVEIAPFPLAWDVVEGVVRVYPADVPEGALCLPCVPVTVQGTMTPWQAIKAVAQQINGAYWERPLDRTEGLQVSIAGVGTGALAEPARLERGIGFVAPARFATEPVDVDIVEAPARDALAHIQAASGYAFNMRYRHRSPGVEGGRMDTLLVFLDWGATYEESRAKRDKHRATLEEAVLWQTSQEEVRRGQYGVDWVWADDDIDRFLGIPPLDPARLPWPIDPAAVP